MIRTLIVDDLQLLRDLMVMMLKNNEEIEVIGMAGNGCDAVEMVKRLKPDVILLDLHMPECSGIDAIKSIRKEKLDTKILVLTASAEEKDVSEALSNGADGYVLKTITKEELILAIKGVHADMEIIQKDVRHFSVKAHDIAKVTSKNMTRIMINDMEVELSEREMAVIRMVVDGKSTLEMAQQLFLAEGRVRNIITEIISKLMLRDKTQLAVFALRNKLVE